ncbi:MAG: LacI family DNA-binding transcriptional regulator [Verrucomicrobia bacterium]|nr:LacI family DNA-binding transcriptional regulator [Verrucomicrobiota bacterium]MCH8511170.1 LacI family transcriptional regulator [Kiritimatiellia bacterium]
MPASIKEIAKMTGYSAQTVSRVLNNNGAGHRKSTCDEILKVAESMGYRPNALARAMVLGKFGSIGLLLSTNAGRSYLPSSLLTSIHDTLADQNLHLTIGRLPDEKLVDSDYMPKMLREWTCDGFLINYTDHAPKEMTDLIHRSRLPSIWINNKREDDCVHPDDFGGGKLAVEYLRTQGHTRIAYLHYRWGESLEDAHYSVVDRMEGYKAGMREAGLDPWILTKGHKIHQEARVETCKEWLVLPDRPTAVITYTSPEYIQIAGLELGMKWEEIPQVLSFSDRPVSIAGRPQTIVYLDQYLLGRAAVESLLEKTLNPEQKLAPKKIEYCVNIGPDKVFRLPPS